MQHSPDVLCHLLAISDNEAQVVVLLSPVSCAWTCMYKFPYPLHHLILGYIFAQARG